MRKTTYTVALLAMAMLAVPISGMAELMHPIPLYGRWTGGVFSDDNTHKFGACVASVPYVTGIAMFVTINRTMGWSIGFRSEGWNLQPQAQIPLAISFDGQSPWSGSAVALDAHMVTIPMATDSHLITSFRAAYQMTITAAGRVYPFNLDGTSRLMISLSQCVATQLAIERGEQPPTFNTQPATKAVNTLPPPPPAPQYELFAMRLASNLLLQTKLPNAHLLATTEIPPQLRGHGVVWTSDAGIGAVMVFSSAVAGKDAQQATTWLISSDASACKGDFVSGRASELVDNTIVARSTTECKDSAGLHVHRFFTIPAPTNGDFVVFEIDHDGMERFVPAPDSPLADTNFQAAAVKATFSK